MRVEYKATPTNLKPYALNNEDLISIGRVVRAWATVEDAATRWIWFVTQMDPVHLLLMLGRMTVSGRIKLAAELAKSKPGRTSDLHKAMFDNEDFHKIAKFRNAVTHGIILGKNEDDEVAFRSQDISATGLNELALSVFCWKAEDFPSYADTAERLANAITQTRWYQQSNSVFLTPSLAPHPKAQAKGKRAAKSGTRDQSSPR